MTLPVTWFLYQTNSDNRPLLYQIRQREKRLVELSDTWSMKVNSTNGTGYPSEEIRTPGGHVSTDNRSPSSASGSLHPDEEDYAGEIWEELDTIFRAQESDFVAHNDMSMSLVLGTPIPFDSPTAATTLHDTPGTPTPLQQQPPIVYLAAPDHRLLLPSHPISPLRLPKPRPQHKNTSRALAKPGVSSSPEATTSPLGGMGDGSLSSRQREVARASPSQRYFACEDQISELRKPKSWVHGAVISTLGDTFCYTTRSKLRHQHYDILPTYIYGLWQDWVESGTENLRSILSYTRACTHPSGCRAWLVPVLMENHWYLLAFDWVDCKIRVYDSLSVSGPPLSPLIQFSLAFVHVVYEDSGLKHVDWRVLPEEVCSFFVVSELI